LFTSLMPCVEHCFLPHKNRLTMHFHERITPAPAVPIGNSHTKSRRTVLALPQPLNKTLVLQNTVPFALAKSRLNSGESLFHPTGSNPHVTIQVSHEKTDPGLSLGERDPSQSVRTPWQSARCRTRGTRHGRTMHCLLQNVGLRSPCIDRSDRKNATLNC